LRPDVHQGREATFLLCRLSDHDERDASTIKQIDLKPVIGSVGAGFVASLCCGGSLVFGSIGVGALYGAMGLSRYIPQALAAGALAIVAVNYLFYVHAAKRTDAKAGNVLALRKAMFLSAALGLAAMAASFVFLEWLNHAVVNPHFLARHAYGQALIPGVPNARLLYALAVFAALAPLWALPWPDTSFIESEVHPALRQALRWSVFAAAVVLLVVLVANGMTGGSGGHGGARNSSSGHSTGSRSY
jgi:hypothetical protein